MSDESLYYAALRRLSYVTSGSTDFEKICRILVRFMYRDYDFNPPEGGLGTKDGGYDGYDPIKKAKLACSLDKEYKSKIKSEVEKSKKNGDLRIFYFSNRPISEPEKKRIEAKHIQDGIELIISGIDILSQKADELLRAESNQELCDLLCLSFLKSGELYKRSDARPVNISYNGNKYKKRIVINDSSSNISAQIKESENPLLDFALSCFLEKDVDTFKNITLCGIGYIGKSFLMKTTYNALIEEFSDKEASFKYQYMPFIQFRELKNYRPDGITNIIKNNIDPVLIFLDGLDEISEPNRMTLNKELQDIIAGNNRAHFIVSGRTSSFVDIDIFQDSAKLSIEKYIDYNDTELVRLMVYYKDTPIADLLPIPMYRNFVLGKNLPKDTARQELYTYLVKENLLKDKERRDISNNISSRSTSAINIDIIIKKMSNFSFKLFTDRKNIFTGDELKEKLANESTFILVINSSIIDYHNENDIGFISNFYYEYFVANALLSMDTTVITQTFFIGNRIRVALIDILILFLDCAKTKSPDVYDIVLEKVLNDSIVYILLCEFDSMSDDERYDYFKSIFKRYKQENRRIYYYRSQQKYGPLKNIDNMAQRMQQLLPERYNAECANFLISEVTDFLQHQSEEDILSFGNATMLLTPFIEGLWPKEQHNALKTISLQLIRFFLYDNTSEKLNWLSAEELIFEWYKIHNWTIGWAQEEWELFYKNISGDTCNLLSEISDNKEFTIKFHCFACFQNNDCIKAMSLPILRYAMKNIYTNLHGMATYAPEIITDDYKTNVFQIDDRVHVLSSRLEKIELCIPEILDLLIFSIENDLYRRLAGTFSSPIPILEKKLYDNIGALKDTDYKRFSQYYFAIDKMDYSDKLFELGTKDAIDDLKEFLVGEVIDRNEKTWNTGFFLSRLIDFISIERSLKCLERLKEKMTRDIYTDTMQWVYKNKDHILHNSECFIGAHNALFEERLRGNAEVEKYLEDIKAKIEKSHKNDIALMLNHNAMITELKEIDLFLSDPSMKKEPLTSLDRLYPLRHQNIIRKTQYDRINNMLPIFSACAIKILSYFYRNDIFDIDAIIKTLQKYLFREDYFYIYFYLVLIDHTHDEESILTALDGHPNELTKRILDSMDKDASSKFINNSLNDFEKGDTRWLTPFFYFYETILNKIPPKWMRPEHILKLIVVPDPRKTDPPLSTELSLHWLLDTFPSIPPSQVIEYGLENIENVTDLFARTQIVKFFIDYYKSNEQDVLKNKILDFIINTTKRLFSATLASHELADLQYIGQYWSESDSNHIDRLFSKFTVKIVTTTTQQSEERSSHQCKEAVLQYCARLATVEQKTKIIREVEDDLTNKTLSDIEYDNTHTFLASLGREGSINLIISSYLNGNAISEEYRSNAYPFGFIEQYRSVLKSFITLFVYSMEKHTERRSILLNIAKSGIRQHLNKSNFKTFEDAICVEIEQFRKQSGWKSEYCEDFLLQMEQHVYS